MSQKKPYKDSKKSRTVPYNDKKNKTNTVKNKEDKELSKTKKLENTVRIRIDEERLNDSDSLDTSFLSGRVNTKAQKDKKIKEKILRERKEHIINISIIKNIFFLLSILCIVAVVIMIIVNYDDFLKLNSKDTKTSTETVEELDKDKEKIIDDNYLFVGNFYLEDMDFIELEFYKPTVKVIESDITTSMILDNLNHYIYQYNPSHVFLQIGLKELLDEEDINDIISHYRTIIEGIQENRSYTKIFIESLYPIYSEEEGISNDKINDYNKKLKVLASSLDVTYIDVYHELDSSYYSDGVHLNRDGVKKVWKIIRKFV